MKNAKNKIIEIPLFKQRDESPFDNGLSALICNTVGSYLCMGAKDICPNENYNDKEVELCNKLAKVIIKEVLASI